MGLTVASTDQVVGAGTVAYLMGKLAAGPTVRLVGARVASFCMLVIFLLSMITIGVGHSSATVSLVFGAWFLFNFESAHAWAIVTATVAGWVDDEHLGISVRARGARPSTPHRVVARARTPPVRTADRPPLSTTGGTADARLRARDRDGARGVRLDDEARGRRARVGRAVHCLRDHAARDPRAHACERWRRRQKLPLAARRPRRRAAALQPVVCRAAARPARGARIARRRDDRALGARARALRHLHAYARSLPDGRGGSTQLLPLETPGTAAALASARRSTTRCGARAAAARCCCSARAAPSSS